MDLTTIQGAMKRGSHEDRVVLMIGLPPAAPLSARVGADELSRDVELPKRKSRGCAIQRG
jgi:hypothetical protein